MSDYISKSEAIEELDKKVHPRVNGVDVFWMATRCIEELPTLDEKEIIRKAFERVVERLEMKQPTSWEHDAYWNGVKETLEEAIEIVKEECGINE